MRTTLTLDDDVAARLAQLRERRDRPFRQLVNDALRAGLQALDAPAGPRGAPRTRPVDLGRSLLPDIDDVSDVLATIEGEGHR